MLSSSNLVRVSVSEKWLLPVESSLARWADWWLDKVPIAFSISHLSLPSCAEVVGDVNAGFLLVLLEGKT